MPALYGNDTSVYRKPAATPISRSTYNPFAPKEQAPTFDPSQYVPPATQTPPAPSMTLPSVAMPSPQTVANAIVESKRQENWQAKQSGLYNKVLARNGVAVGPAPYTGGNNIINNAYKYKGVEYRWGGKSAKSGLDCSGFTQLVARDSGVNIPGSTATQLAWFKSKGLLVSTKNLQPGDYVYFKSSGPTGRHVGIYIGNGKMIDSPKTGDVVGVHSIAGRTIIGVGRLPQKGDARATKYVDSVRPGDAPFGLDTKLYAALDKMNAAMQRAGAGKITVTQGYRDNEQQAALRASQPAFAAPVGKSKHGHGGRAADINVTDPSGWSWLQRNAHRYGVTFPASDEPWHAELDPRR